jgi:hypothetical protein
LGQGFIKLNGRPIDCGWHDLPESEARAHRLIAQWLAAGKRLDDGEAKSLKRGDPPSATGPAVEVILARFWLDAEQRYAPRTSYAPRLNGSRRPNSTTTASSWTSSGASMPRRPPRRSDPERFTSCATR